MTTPDASPKNERRLLIDPARQVLQSRRVLIALVTLIVGLLMSAVPELSAVRDELLALLTTLALALIGGYSVEDAARAAREARPPQAAPDTREALRDVLQSALDEALRERKDDPPR